MLKVFYWLLTNPLTIKLWKPDIYVCLQQNNNKAKVIVCVRPKFPILHKIKKESQTTSWVDCCQKSKFLHKFVWDPHRDEKIFHEMIFIFFWGMSQRYLFNKLSMYVWDDCVRDVLYVMNLHSLLSSVNMNLPSLVTNNDMNSKSFQNCLTDTQKNLCQTIPTKHWIMNSKKLNKN